MIDRVEEAMMDRALRMAHCAASLGEVPVGAVIYHGDQVIAEGHNRRETDGDPTAHAEIIALRRAGNAVGRWRMDGFSMAVTLEPCPMCAGALVNSRMARLVYGAADPKMGCVDTLHQLCRDPRFNHRLQVVPGLRDTACAALLSQFFASRRR